MTTLPRLLYPASEVAEALGVSAYWLCERARKGEIKAQKVAGAWKFTRAQVDGLLRQIERSAEPTPQHAVPSTHRRRSAASAATETAAAPVVRLVAKPPRRRIS